MTRLLLADDDPALRAGLAVVLGSAPDLLVVGEAGDGLTAVELAGQLAVDVVLMDIRMPGIDGIEATRRVLAAASELRVLVLTTFPDDAYVVQALAAGASGFMLKRASPERLIEAVRTIAAGDALLDPAVTRAVIARAVEAGRRSVVEPVALSALTGREREVLALVGEGLSNQEIATRLVIAESTAKTHVKRTLAKLGARDRAQAVVIAHRSGLVGEL